MNNEKNTSTLRREGYVVAPADGEYYSDLEGLKKRRSSYEKNRQTRQTLLRPTNEEPA